MPLVGNPNIGAVCHSEVKPLVNLTRILAAAATTQHDPIGWTANLILVAT